VKSADMLAVLDGERDVPRAPRSGGAGHAHEQIAEDGARRIAGCADRGGDEVERRAGQEGHVVAAIGEQLIRIAVAPVLLDAGAVAQVLDSRAAYIDQPCERARLGDLGQSPAERIDALLQRRAQMRGAETEDVTDGVNEAMPVALAVVARAARDEASHRVPDEDDLVERHRPHLA
jgi:hypothetical protein